MKYPTTKDHWEKYETLRRKWGLCITFRTFAGFSREQMLEKLRADPHLNNVMPLRAWDGYSAHLVGKQNLADHGASIAEALCTMKHAVRMWTGAEPVFVEWDDDSLRDNYPRRPEWD